MQPIIPTIMPPITTFSSTIEGQLKLAENQNHVRGIDPKQLKKVCEDFEAIFIKQLFKEMRKTLSNGGIMGKSVRAQIYQDIIDEQIALKMAHAGGIGIGEKLYRALAMRFREELEKSNKEGVHVKEIRDHVKHEINYLKTHKKEEG